MLFPSQIFYSSIDERVCFRFSTSLILNSRNGIRDVRLKLVEQKGMQWAYVFVTHCLNNSFENLVMTCFSIVTKEGFIDSKTIRRTNMVRKIFEALCEINLGN